LIEAFQFAGIGDPVAVPILPNSQFAPDQVGSADLAVAIAVILRQLSVAALEAIAEHLGNIVDPAVAIVVEDEKPVVALEPSRLLTEKVAVDIEISLAVGEPDGFDAVAIKVDHQRIDLFRPLHSLGKANGRRCQRNGIIDKMAAAGKRKINEAWRQLRQYVDQYVGLLERHVQRALT